MLTHHDSTTLQMAFVPADHNPTWKYFTYQFAHASFGHLLSNMWYLAVFGWILENALGSILFLTMTLSLGAIAVIPEFIFQVDPTIPIVGASGSVAVMMGAAAAMFPRSKVRLLFTIIPMPNIPNSFFIPLRYLIYFWLILQVSGLAMNVWVDPRPIAYATHLTGFALGLGFGLLFRLKHTESWLDIELSGRDLKDFYSGLKAYQLNLVDEGNHCLEQISRKWPWVFTLQLKLFQIAISHRQKDLAEKIWKPLSSGLLMLKRQREAEWALQEFIKAFGDLPQLQVQECVMLSRLLRGHLSEESELAIRLNRVATI
jgi:membrane associated rhomboid family serine protease